MFPDLSRELQEMHEMGLVISPWLAGIGPVRFDPSVFEVIDLEVREFVLTQWTMDERLKVFGSLPSNDRMARTAVYEVVSSTAVFQAHQKTGQLDVDDEIAEEAFRLVKQYTQEHGYSTLVLLYMLATSWENQNALAYYGEIPEQEFLFGQWHRPWIDYSIWDELLFDCLIGTVRVVLCDNQRYIQLTDAGHKALERTTDILYRSGYFSQRLQTLRISQFSMYNDYAALANEIWPDFMDLRRSFLDWSGIKPGMKVLELGCADGVFTFDGGLAERVGPTGRLVSVDPSSGMIARANTRRRDLGYHWVEFKRGFAESLPFADGEFDAVIGTAFLHFTDRQTALREMRRVVRPGGIVASYHPTKFTPNVPFFREWFSPLFEIAATRHDEPRDYLPTSEEVLTAFKEAGLVDIFVEDAPVTTLYHDPEKVVRHFIEGVGWFSEELSPLPWQARAQLILSLKDKGREVSEKYSKNERVILFPNQMVKGIVPDLNN